MTPATGITDERLDMFEKEEAKNKIPQAILSDFTPVPQTKNPSPISLSLSRYLIPLLLNTFPTSFLSSRNKIYIYIYVHIYIYISTLPEYTRSNANAMKGSVYRTKRKKKSKKTKA